MSQKSLPRCQRLRDIPVNRDWLGGTMKEALASVLDRKADSSLYCFWAHICICCTVLPKCVAGSQITRLEAQSTEHRDDRCQQGHPRGLGDLACHSAILAAFLLGVLNVYKQIVEEQEDTKPVRCFPEPRPLVSGSPGFPSTRQKGTCHKSRSTRLGDDFLDTHL